MQALISADSGLGLSIAMNMRSGSSFKYYDRIFSTLQEHFKIEVETNVPQDFKELAAQAKAQIDAYSWPAIPITRSTGLPLEKFRKFVGVYKSKVATDLEVFWTMENKLGIRFAGSDLFLEQIDPQRGKFQMLNHPTYFNESVEFLCDANEQVMQLRFCLSRYLYAAGWNPNAGKLHVCKIRPE